MSPSVEKILGYKAQDFIDRPLPTRIHPVASISELAIHHLGQIFKGSIIPASCL